MPNKSALITRLEKLDACAVSDALDSIGQPGALSGLSRRATGKRIAGVVQTVKLHSHPPEGGSKRHLGTAAVEAADAQTIIVVEQRSGIACAGWGGVLANACKAKNIRGVIVEGPARDIDECEAIGLPIFARSTTPHTARGRVYEQSFGEPIQVGDLTVRTGDYAIADGSGVVFIAANKAERVIGIAEKLATKEKLMTLDILAGKPVSQVMGASYETMLESGDE